MKLKIAGILSLAFLTWAHSNESVKLSGSLRFRHEGIFVEDKDGRNRERIQAKLAVEGKVAESAKVKIGLASGSADPVSTNQTLGSGWSSKSIWLDIAYLTYSPSYAKGLSLSLGKLKMPFHTPSGAKLVWDGDVTPEGALLSYEKEGEGKFLPFISVGHFWLSEIKDDYDPMLISAQAGASIDMGPVSADLGAGLYSYQNLLGAAALYDGDFFGNSGDSTGYTEEYMPIEVYANLKTKFGKFPASLSGHFVTNPLVDEDGMGFMAGFQLGKAKDPQSWSLGYSYKMLQKDAVLAVFADSDFGGGGTDNMGSVVSAQYVMLKNTTLAGTYFFNELGADGGDLYQRFQLDIKMKFK